MLCLALRPVQQPYMHLKGKGEFPEEEVQGGLSGSRKPKGEHGARLP